LVAVLVHLDGYAVRSCQINIETAVGKKITTIEGLAYSADTLHPVQQAWLNHDVAQCGYCQPGQMMSAAALLNVNNSPSDEDIDNFMQGNICRCGTYTRIRAAIKTAADLT
jgi:aerobic-type carbon monoxide dehydrogenase small subunit (CoxS/CutS family)